MLPPPALSPKSLSVLPLLSVAAAVEVLVKLQITLGAKVLVKTHVDLDAKTPVKATLGAKVPVKTHVEPDVKMPAKILTMPNALLREDAAETDAEIPLILLVLRPPKCQKEVLALNSLKPALAKPPSKS